MVSGLNRASTYLAATSLCNLIFMLVQCSYKVAYVKSKAAIVNAIRIQSASVQCEGYLRDLWVF